MTKILPDIKKIQGLLVYDKETGFLHHRLPNGKKGPRACELPTSYHNRDDDSCRPSTSYNLVVMIDSSKYLAKEIVFYLHHKKIPQSPIVHIDKNKHNNRIMNLKLKPFT